MGVLRILKRLREAGVDFVLVGGMAAAAHGSSVVTEDVDVCIRFDRDTVARVLGALGDLHPRARMRPDRPLLETNPDTYVGWKNLYVVTDDGQIDFLGQVTGVGEFDVLASGAVRLSLGDFDCRVIGLDDLIRSKRALGRPKDLRAAAELEVIRSRLQPR